MSALQRTEADLKAGNYGLGRMRLESYVSSKGYDAELMARIGQICYDMHDLFNAGRMWVVSTAQREHVERAIEFFLRAANHDPRQAVGQLLPAARRPSLDDYPPDVQKRLRSAGLADTLIEAHRNRQVRIAHRVTPGARVFKYALVALIIACMGSCVVGVKTILSWMF